MLKKFFQIFSDFLRKDKTGQHYLKLTSNTPINTELYPIPIEFKANVETEINEQGSQKVQEDIFDLLCKFCTTN